MPTRPARPCRQRGCPQLTIDKSGYCEQHLKASRQQQDARRGAASERGYDARWHRARTAYLSEHPLCVMCEAEGKIVAATIVDHIKAHKGDMVLFWDESNWQSLCLYHNSAKAAREEGAFGNARG